MGMTVPTHPRIAVIGLGYVGLPLAAAFAEAYSVIGFDIDPPPHRRAGGWRGSHR